MTKTLRAIDICAGAGGWACAADRLDGKPIKIVAAIDFAEDCLATYKYNHDKPGGVAEGAEFICSDAREVDYLRWKGIDLVLGAIPCEEISPARVINKVTIEQMENLHSLLDYMLEVPARLGAESWCYEDVIQIEKHLPPLTPRFRINSNQYSPQNRKRTYVGKFPTPAPGNDKRILADVLRPGPYRVTPKVLAGEPATHNTFNPGVYHPWFTDRKSHTVISLGGSRHDNFSAIVMPDGRPRSIQWQEAAALQGFPENYVFVGSLSRTSKMIGQAIQIDTGVAILEAIVAASTGGSA